MGSKLKAVYFNKNTEADLLSFADNISNFSEWVKRKIRQELQFQKTGVDPEIKNLIEKLIETKLAGKVINNASPKEVKDDILGDLERFF